jgi:hypothetical protein
MITLTTGVPGSGKSLYSIDYIKRKAETENRDVYFHGIKDLALPWIELEDPTKWDELPIGAIIVIDECQTIFRPRGAGSQVPSYIAAMETHRHKGYDIFLITQHPMLVDQNIRRLVGQHFHVVRKFGMQRATVHEFGSCHEITQRNLAQAVRHDYKYTAEAFSYYKSAEMHTHKRRIPARVYFLMAAPLLIAALVWFGWKKLDQVKDHQTKQNTELTSQGAGSTTTTTQDKQLAYLEQYVPRVKNLPWTAAAYDEQTKPQDAPRPMACIENHTKKTCRCVDQQGNTLHVDANFCGNFIKHGMFVAWIKPAEAPAASEAIRDKARADIGEGVMPGVVITGSKQTPTPPGPAEHING